MKTNTLNTILFAFLITTGSIATAVASWTPPTPIPVDVYVRRDESIPLTISTPLIFAGNYVIDPTVSGVDVKIFVDDRRTGPAADERKARNISDTIWKTFFPTVLSSAVVIM